VTDEQRQWNDAAQQLWDAITRFDWDAAAAVVGELPALRTSEPCCKRPNA